MFYSGTRSVTPVHRFALGDAVRMRGMLFTPALASYRVTAMLPTRDGSPQYRVRSDLERHERVAKEDTLEIVQEGGGEEAR